MIGVTLSAQLATLPAVAAFYGSIPLLATLTNLLAIPITMCALPVSIVALAVSTVWPWGGAMLAAVADGLLSALTFVTRVGAALPLSGVKLTAFPGWLCALYALTVVLLSDLSALRLRVRQWLLPVLLVLTAVPVVLAAGRDGGLEILFLDAGQADAAAIWAEGELYLMDVGLEDTPVDDYLVWRAATPKAIFLSHPHDDHAGGLGAVLAVCRPETIYLPAGWNAADADADALEHLRRAVEMGCDLVEVCAGDRIQLSQNVEAEVLFPCADASSDSANEISMLVCVR